MHLWPSFIPSSELNMKLHMYCLNEQLVFCVPYYIFTKIGNMKKKVIVHPQRELSFVTGAYSDGVLVDGLLFVSGQASVDFTTSKFMLGSIEEETIRTMDNIKAIIESAGATMDDVVKCTAHLADINDFERYNKVYATYFSGIKPARTTVQSVLAENIKVEIDAIVKMPI